MSGPNTFRAATLFTVALMLGLGTVTVPLPHGHRQERDVPPMPLEAPVPLLESTPASLDGGAVLHMVLSSLPPPGPNQLRAGQCDPEQAQVTLNGGCWVQTQTPPPCPRGKQWEHEGHCWLPVAPAKPLPTSGGGSTQGVARP